MEKIKKYTESFMVRLDKATMQKLKVKSLELEMNEAVYGRKAIELCLKRNLINGKKGKIALRQGKGR